VVSPEILLHSDRDFDPIEKYGGRSAGSGLLKCFHINWLSWPDPFKFVRRLPGCHPQ